MRIGFIGLGAMGQPMFRNLVHRFPGALGYDASAERRAELAAQPDAAQGIVATMQALGAPDVLFTMLPDGKVVRRCLFEPAGAGEPALVERMAAGALVVDLSSSSPLDTLALARDLAGRGIGLMDAPVSGSVPKARAGTLAIMLGCDDDAARERVMPLLQAMGERIIPTGRAGSAHAMKTLNNYVYAAGLLAASEALLLARALDLDLSVLTDVLNASSGRNVATETKLKQHMLEGGDFKGGFGLHLMAKDLTIAHGLGAHAGFEPPQLALCQALWQDAGAELRHGADNTEIYRYLAGRLKASAPAAGG